LETVTFVIKRLSRHSIKHNRTEHRS